MNTAVKAPRWRTRSLFFTIFLWFFGAQLLVGAALYGLAVVTERRFDRDTTEQAGGYLEARAKAAAVAFEVGGRDAAQEAWRLALPDDLREPGSRRDGFGRGDGVRGDGFRRRGPEDRGSAALLVVRASELERIAGPPLDEGVLRRAVTSDAGITIQSDRGLWLARRVETANGRYLALMRLRERGGPPRGFWDGFWGGRPGPGRSLWGGIVRWLVIVTTMALVSFALARTLTDPALKISRAARRFAEGDYSVRVGPQLGRRRDELGDLGRDFDFMAERIAAQREGERRLLGDISHELRSPLARLKIALELAEGSASPDDLATREFLTRIEEEVEELDALIGQLLTLTRLENAERHVQTGQIVELNELLADVCADADFEASATGRTVELVENQSARVRGSDSLLRSAIENVVRNAILHALDSSKIEVSLQTTENEAVIRVRDWGPGVPESALEELFLPFFRVAEARDRQSGGTGLGLSITQRAFASHGGSVRARNVASGGLEVEMRLPLAL